MWLFKPIQGTPYKIFKIFLFLTLTFSLAIFGSAVAIKVNAQTSLAILSGPQVSYVTDTTAVISWTTSAESTTAVHFGTTEAMGKVFRKIVPMEETEVLEITHNMTLWELLPETTYYYKTVSVATDGSRVESAVLSFDTQPILNNEDLAENDIEDDEDKPKHEDLCAEPWDCNEWSECDSTGQQVRSCSLKNECVAFMTASPETIRKCEFSEAETEPKNDKPPDNLIDNKSKPTQPEKNKPVDESISGNSVDKNNTAPDKTITAPTGGSVIVKPEVNVSSREVVTKAIQNQLSGFDSQQIVEVTYERLTEKQSEIISGARLTDQQIERCLSNGITKEACFSWLSMQTANKDCRENGYLTVERCEEYILNQYNGIFPGCENISDEDCEAIKAYSLISYFDEEDYALANSLVVAAVETANTTKLPVGLTPIQTAIAPRVKWVPSVVEANRDISPAVLTLDSDKDGLPDSVEEYLGTDIFSEDTDGDGVSDKDEILAGTNPLGAGVLDIEADEVLDLFVKDKPLDQPRGSGEIDSELVVQVAEENNGGLTQAKLSLSGSCKNNTACLLYVYSYIPMVYVASVTADGSYQVTIGDHIMDGEHTAYVAVVDDTGRIVKKSSPFNFFVREAQSINEDEYLSGFDIKEEAMPLPGAFGGTTRGFIFGALVLIILASTIVFVLVGNVKKEKL